MRKKRGWKGVRIFSLQCKYDMIVIQGRVCHLSGDTDILLGFVWIVIILNSVFRGNAMESETAVEELKVLRFVVKPVVIISNGRKLGTYMYMYTVRR